MQGKEASRHAPATSSNPHSGRTDEPPREHGQSSPAERTSQHSSAFGERGCQWQLGLAEATYAPVLPRPYRSTGTKHSQAFLRHGQEGGSVPAPSPA